MKVIISIIFLFKILPIFGQSLPGFESNTTEKQRAESLLLSKLIKGKKFDQFIAYSEYHTYGIDRPPYTLYAILIKIGNKWDVEKWSVEDDSTGRKNLIPIGLEVTLDSMKLDSLFRFLSEMDFYNISNDSLNIRQLPGSNSFSYMFHGTEVQFDIFSNNKFRVYNVYMPEFYQKEVPINQRKKFIICKNRLKEFLISSKILYKSD